LFYSNCICYEIAANPIDTIQTIGQALAFAEKYPHRGAPINTTWIDSSLGEKSWCKEDIDGNGLIDLLITCTESECFTKFGMAFMAFPDTIKEYDLQIASVTHCVISKCKSQPIIILYKHVFNDTVPAFTAPLTSILVCDTVVYRNGLFVKFNKHPYIKEFDSITMVTGQDFFGSPDFKITVTSKGTSLMIPITYNKYHKPQMSGYKYRAKIDSDQLSQLADMINYIDFKNLDSAASRKSTTFNRRITFQIRLKDGTRLQIKDRYSYCYATKGLTQFMSDLYDKQKWVRLAQNNKKRHRRTSGASIRFFM
jgi:hypothetical protein